MKLRFKEKCKDKYTGTMYEKGETYEFEDERGQDIIKTGRAELVLDIRSEGTGVSQEDVKEVTDLEVELDKGEMVNLQNVSKEELIKLAKKMHVSIRGSKEDIIERIMAASETEKGE